MKTSSRKRGISARHGISCAWALVVLSVLTVMLAVASQGMLFNRQSLHRRHDQLQASWLARSGVELAAARLLEDSKAFTEETTELLPGSRLRIEVQEDQKKPGTWVVNAKASLPPEGRSQSVCTITRRFERIVDKDKVNLKCVDGDNSIKLPQ